MTKMTAGGWIGRPAGALLLALAVVGGACKAKTEPKQVAYTGGGMRTLTDAESAAVAAKPAAGDAAKSAAAQAAGGADASKLSPEEHGALLFKARGCIVCHAPGQRKPIGADLAGLFGSTVKFADGTTATADEAYLRESILDPNAKVTADFKPIMPSFRGQLDAQQLDAIVAYLKSLKKP